MYTSIWRRRYCYEIILPPQAQISHSETCTHLLMVFLFLSLNIHAKYETEQISLIVTTIASYYQFPSTFSVGLFTFMFWTPPPLSYNGINQIHKRVKSWTYAPQIYAKNCNGCQFSL